MECIKKFVIKKKVFLTPVNSHRYANFEVISPKFPSGILPGPKNVMKLKN